MGGGTEVREGEKQNNEERQRKEFFYKDSILSIINTTQQLNANLSSLRKVRTGFLKFVFSNITFVKRMQSTGVKIESDGFYKAFLWYFRDQTELLGVKIK